MTRVIQSFLSGLSIFFLMLSPTFANNADNVKNSLLWLWGSSPCETRLYLGMWSVHATKKERNGNNQLIGFSYNSFAAGTFVNSYGNRGVTVGIQRIWLTGLLKHDLNYQLGYRFGLVSGYEGHNLTGIEATRNWPVIPYAQLIFDLSWKHLGIEFSTSSPYVLATSFYIKF